MQLHDWEEKKNFLLLSDSTESLSRNLKSMKLLSRLPLEVPTHSHVGGETIFAYVGLKDIFLCVSAYQAAPFACLCTTLRLEEQTF